MNETDIDWSRLLRLAGTALVNLPRDDLDERVDRIVRGVEPEGISMSPFDESGRTTLFWAGRELVRLHRTDLLRRDTAGLN